MEVPRENFYSALWFTELTVFPDLKSGVLRMKMAALYDLRYSSENTLGSAFYCSDIKYVKFHYRLLVILPYTGILLYALYKYSLLN